MTKTDMVSFAKDKIKELTLKEDYMDNVILQLSNNGTVIVSYNMMDILMENEQEGFYVVFTVCSVDGEQHISAKWWVQAKISGKMEIVRDTELTKDIGNYFSILYFQCRRMFVMYLARTNMDNISNPFLIQTAVKPLASACLNNYEGHNNKENNV